MLKERKIIKTISIISIKELSYTPTPTLPPFFFKIKARLAPTYSMWLLLFGSKMGSACFHMEFLHEGAADYPLSVVGAQGAASYC